jgi:hypothetical protein
MNYLYNCIPLALNVHVSIQSLQLKNHIVKSWVFCCTPVARHVSQLQLNWAVRCPVPSASGHSFWPSCSWPRSPTTSKAIVPYLMMAMSTTYPAGFYPLGWGYGSKSEPMDMQMAKNPYPMGIEGAGMILHNPHPHTHLPIYDMRVRERLCVRTCQMFHPVLSVAGNRLHWTCINPDRQTWTGIATSKV